MGLRLPINGYFSPRGHRRGRLDEQNPWNEGRREKIEQFIEAMQRFSQETHIFYRPTGTEDWRGRIEMETNEDSRTVLKGLLKEVGGPATLVIYDKNDISGSKAPELIGEILKREIAVIPLKWECLSPYFGGETWTADAAKSALENSLRFRAHLQYVLFGHMREKNREASAGNL